MRAILRHLTLAVAGAAVLLTSVGQAPAKTPSYSSPYQRYLRAHRLRLAVVAFANNHMGQKVGAGQCWDLVDQALRSAGADTSGDGNYVFGTPIDLANITPGDCLQFEGVHFEHHDPSGASSWSDYGHHSAIVAEVSGRTIKVLNQNVGGDMTVQYSTFNLDDKTRGTITAYRPKAK